MGLFDRAVEKAKEAASDMAQRAAPAADRAMDAALDAYSAVDERSGGKLSETVERAKQRASEKVEGAGNASESVDEIAETEDGNEHAAAADADAGGRLTPAMSESGDSHQSKGERTSEREAERLTYDSGDPIGIKMVNSALGTLDDLFRGDLDLAVRFMWARFFRDGLDSISLEHAERTAKLALKPLAELELLPDEFLPSARQTFTDFVRIAIPAYEASSRIAAAMRNGSLQAQRVSIFVDWLDKAAGRVSAFREGRAAYGDYRRSVERAAKAGSAEDAEALGYVKSWFAEWRIAAEVERLGRPGAVEVLCRKYALLRDWEHSPPGGMLTWEILAPPRPSLPVRGEWVWG